MSYLLEALQKSQKEREQQVPGLQTPALQVEVPDEAPRSPWIYIAIAALVINSFVLLYLVLRPEPTPQLVVATAPESSATPVAPSPQPLVTSNAVDRVQIRDLQTEANVIREPSPTLVVTDNPIVTAPTPTVIAAENTNETAIDVDLFSVPRVNQLPDDVRRQLPELVMNSHIYAPNEKDSFVMINGVSATPGMLLMPNLKMLAITADGVVLQFNEHKFLLPSLSSFKP